MLFAGLCACGPVETENPRTTATIAPTTVEAPLTSIAFEMIESSMQTVTIKIEKNDPLSYVIEEYLEVYNECLYDQNRNMSPHYYALYDLDGNGTQELLIAELFGDDIRLYDVYVIRNGAAVRQEEFQTLGGGGITLPSVVFKNGTIRIDGHYDVLPTIVYYRFKNGELRHQETLMDDFLGQQYLRHNRNNAFPGTPITKAEFDRVQKEMEGDGQVVELDWKPLTEYGR